MMVFRGEHFPTTYIPTVFENYTTELKINNNTLNLSLYDTAGQDDYERLRPLSNPNSIENIEYKWRVEISKYLPNVPIILAGNKSDLRGDHRVLSRLKQMGHENIMTKEELKKFAKRLAFTDYFDISAKSNVNIQELFKNAAFIGYLY